MPAAFHFRRKASRPLHALVLWALPAALVSLSASAHEPPPAPQSAPPPGPPPEIVRKGGQWGILVGGSACIPGRASCGRSSELDGGLTVDGSTRPSVAAGAEMGYRLHRFVFVGAAYRFGMFDTAYIPHSGVPYDLGYQHSVYGMVRPILPVWRFDLGLTLGPGFSRQVFRSADGSKDYSQGFSFALGPTVDVFISSRVFIGVRGELLLNAHRKYCRGGGQDSACGPSGPEDLGPVHQMVFGLHVGGTFL